jgi:hypothetical protein
MLNQGNVGAKDRVYLRGHVSCPALYPNWSVTLLLRYESWSLYKHFCTPVM